VARWAALLLLAVAAVHAQEAQDPVDAALARLQAPDVKERTRAARALGKLGGDRAAAALRQALDDEAEPVRLAAAAALVGQGRTGEALVAVLGACLHSEDWYTRWQACLALGRMGPAARGAAPVLVDAALDESRDVAREATLALIRIDPGGTAVQEAFVQLLLRDRAFDPGLLLDLLRPERAKEILPWLDQELESDAHHLRQRACDLLVKAGTGGVLVLTDALASKDANVRELAAAGLGRVRADRSAKVAPDLIRGMRGEAGARGRIGLWELGYAELVSALDCRWHRVEKGPLALVGVRELRVRLLIPDGGRTHTLRTIAEDLEDKSRGPDLVEALRAVLDESSEEDWRAHLGAGNKEQQICAAVLLGLLARDGEKALPLLEAAARSDDGALQAAATRAIERLEKRG